MHGKFALLCLTTALLGCQTASYVGDENSPFYAVPAGSRVTLNRELTVPPEQVGVYIQNGRVRENVELDHYSPFCKFELYTRSPVARTVSPDTILIIKSQHERWDGPLAFGQPPMLVAGLALRVADRDGGFPPISSFSNRMDLRSEAQPEIYRLTCAKWGYPGIHRHATIAENQKTLGDVLTLRLSHQ